MISHDMAKIFVVEISCLIEMIKIEKRNDKESEKAKKMFEQA